MSSNPVCFPNVGKGDSQLMVSPLTFRHDDSELDFGEDARRESNFDGIVGQSRALREVLQLVETVAGCDSTVLLLGETDRKSTRLNSSHRSLSRMPSSA